MTAVPDSASATVRVVFGGAKRRINPACRETSRAYSFIAVGNARDENMDLTLFETLKAKLGLVNASKPALVGLAALFVMVAVFAGRFFIDTATATEITIEHGKEASSDAAPAAENGQDAPEASAKAAGSDNAATIFVHVSGAVANPGLVELSEGSRVADAIKAAGGISEDGVAESVNLARKLNDGEQLHVMSKAEADSAGNFNAQAQASNRASSTSGVSGLVNINSATQEELESLPGIGPSTASKIIADRDANGPFSTPDDLMRVTGIGEKKFASIAELICV